MATPLTVSGFFARVKTSAAGALDDLSTDQFLVHLNEALVLRAEELRQMTPSLRSKTATITFTQQSPFVDVPEDFDRMGSFLVYPYEEGSEELSTPLPSGHFSLDGGQIRFTSVQNAGQKYKLFYTPLSNSYDADSQTITETADPRATTMLQNEIKALALAAREEGQPTSGVAHLLQQSNRTF